MDNKILFIIFIIFCAIISIVIIGALFTIIKKVVRGIRSAKRNIEVIGNTISTIGNIAQKVHADMENAEITPEEKTIGGATKIYLPMILKDFPDFHNPDAESDIKSVLKDYINCVHSGKQIFDNNAINKNVLKRIIPKERGSVSNINFHRVEIYNYQKSIDYATITYRASFGYRLNNKQVETRYEIYYTLQLSDQGIASKALKCKNCNAPLNMTTNTTVCPYCEAKIIRDTIMNWVVSDIKELK
jgi:DNA-directed RNA polymerase subunit RPC12/RpoP